MSVRLLRLVLLVSILTACAGGGSTPAAGPVFPLYPMQLVLLGPRETGEPLGALMADGAIVSKHGGLVARLLPDRVVAPDGRPKIVAASNGDVWLDPQRPPMRFNSQDALISSSGETVSVDDAGIPSWVEPGGRGMPPLSLRFVPFTPAARRTAEVLFMVLLEAQWSRPMT